MAADTGFAYPGTVEVDEWLASIWELAKTTDCPVEMLPEQGFTQNLGMYHMPGYVYVKFSPAGMPEFYGYWQPAISGPAPLLVHVPGYGAEISAHPDLVAAGYNVLHVSPLGYSTPKGADESKRQNGEWPVLPDTILTAGKGGYREWLANCAMAVDWALGRPETLADRVSFFGTSQGGGGALLLGSLYNDRGVRCVAADVPFLTDFKGAGGGDGSPAYALFHGIVDSLPDQAAAWQAVGLIDTLSHVHRLDIPVLLTAGGMDETCPPHTIEHLFSRLQGTRSLTFLKGVGHRYTVEFIPLAGAWFRLYA